MKKQDIENRFVELIEQNNGIIYRVASFYADGDNPVEDLYQDIIINLWKGYSSFRNESKPSTWMYKVALNTCISIYRKNKHKFSPVDIDLNLPAPEEESGILKELYSLIDRLGKIERALILLYLDDRSYKEIADITGLSVTNVATKLSRIKENLKQMNNNS